MKHKKVICIIILSIIIIIIGIIVIKKINISIENSKYTLDKVINLLQEKQTCFVKPLKINNFSGKDDEIIEAEIYELEINDNNIISINLIDYFNNQKIIKNKKYFKTYTRIVDDNGRILFYEFNIDNLYLSVSLDEIELIKMGKGFTSKTPKLKHIDYYNHNYTICNIIRIETQVDIPTEIYQNEIYPFTSDYRKNYVGTYKLVKQEISEGTAREKAFFSGLDFISDVPKLFVSIEIKMNNDGKLFAIIPFQNIRYKRNNILDDINSIPQFNPNEPQITNIKKEKYTILEEYSDVLITDPFTNLCKFSFNNPLQDRVNYIELSFINKEQLKIYYKAAERPRTYGAASGLKSYNPFLPSYNSPSYDATYNFSSNGKILEKGIMGEILKKVILEENEFNPNEFNPRERF